MSWVDNIICLDNAMQANENLISWKYRYPFNDKVTIVERPWCRFYFVNTVMSGSYEIALRIICKEILGPKKDKSNKYTEWALIIFA